MRKDLGVELDERDYAKAPLTASELKELFAGRDPRDFLNPRSPAFKAMALAGKSLTPDQAMALMAKEPNLIKRPITIAGKEMIAGFDRDRLRSAEVELGTSNGLGARCFDLETQAFAALEEADDLEEIVCARIARRPKHPHQTLGWNVRRFGEIAEAQRSR